MQCHLFDSVANDSIFCAILSVTLTRDPSGQTEMPTRRIDELN